MTKLILVAVAGADLRSGHLCSGRRGPCHMVLGGFWWKSIKNCITDAKTGFLLLQKVSSDMTYFLIGLHCRLQLHWVTSEWSCFIASHCIWLMSSVPLSLLPFCTTVTSVDVTNANHTVIQL